MIKFWDDTVSRFGELGITPMPVLHLRAFSDRLFEEIASSLDERRQEGFVMRTQSAFRESEMPERMGKYVRAGHVQSDTHWMNMVDIPNRLA